MLCAKPEARNIPLKPLYISKLEEEIHALTPEEVALTSIFVTALETEYIPAS